MCHPTHRVARGANLEDQGEFFNTIDPKQTWARSTASSGQAIPGFFHAPLVVPLEVKGNGVFYLGQINAVVRERQSNEFRAGSPIPLIDQAMIGASGGTFDIDIVDAQASAEALFRERFPALRNATMRKAILPPFVRAAAQKWWEAH